MAGILGVVLSLPACQFSPFKSDSADTEPVLVTDASIAERDARLAALKPWRALGSLVVESEASGTFNATFAWDASVSGFDIRLIGPLGLKTYRLVEDKQGARLYGDEEIAGSSAEELLRDEMGVSIPLVSMQDWVVGLQGAAAEAERDNKGRLSQMLVTENNDNRWRVEFERYRQVDDLDLPRTILVSGDGVEIKVSVRKWSKPDTVANDRLIIPGVGS